MHRRPFAPRRTAEQVGCDSPDEDQRRHAQRHPAAGLVNLLDDQIVAAFDTAAGPLIQQADRVTADGQQEQQPRMRKPGPRRNIEAPQEGRAQRSDEQCHRHENERPAHDRYGMFVAGAHESRDVQRVKQVPERSAHASSLLPDGER